MPTYTDDNNNNTFTAPNDGLVWTIAGNGGNDVLKGGTQNDSIDGGAGNDTLTGGAGYDTINGGDGNDLIIETQGLVDGGAGTDTLRADYSQYDNGAGVHVGYLGRNQIFSRATGTGILNYNNVERFEITGTKYADILQGGASSDSLDGGAGNDELTGNAGNDTLTGGSGYDTLNGGDGDDLLIDTEGVVDGGAGIDTLRADYSQLDNGAGIYVGSLVPNQIISRTTAATSILNYSNIERFEITGTKYEDYLSGGNGNDLLNGGSANDTIAGGAGNDTIYGGTGYDILAGGDGDDLLIDTEGLADGGAGTDTLKADYSQLDNGAGIHLGYQGQSRIFSRLTGNPILYYNSIERFDVTGTKYADVFEGGGSNDTFNGGSGNDNLIGAAGNDTLIGGTGTDTAVYAGNYAEFGISFLSNGDLQVIDQNATNGNEGTDILRGVEVINFAQGVTYGVVTGTAANDVLTAPNYGSFVFGGGGNDTMTGSTGNDYLDGSTGNDSLNGAAGNDTLIGGTGTDTAVYAGNYAEYGISFLSNGDLQIIDQNATNGNEGTDIIRGVEVIKFAQGATYGVVNGTAANDVLTASSNSSFVFGGGGNDTITGAAGNDNLVGGTGNDNLVGGDGNDILTGGAGTDILTGGLGSDTFVFNSISEGIDVIKDFSSQQGDKIQIIGSSFGVTLTSQFNYDQSTGGLFFNAQQFATLENKPSDFSVDFNIQIV